MVEHVEPVLKTTFEGKFKDNIFSMLRPLSLALEAMVEAVWSPQARVYADMAVQTPMSQVSGHDTRNRPMEFATATERF